MFTIVKTERFEKWQKGLKDINAQMRIVKCVRKMELGNLGDVKPVGEGVSETRIHYGTAIVYISASKATL